MINYKLHTKYKDSILNIESLKNVKELETKYQTAKKEKQILVQQVQAKQKNNYLIGLGFLTLFTALFGFLFYRQQKQKNQQQKQEFELKKALILRMKEFLLELGRDFMFLGEELHLKVGMNDFYVDLVFYHRELQCLVAIDLKIDEFKPEYMGKMNFYLELLDRDVRKPHENPSIGVVLCKSKNDEIVEITMSRQLAPALVAVYETKFIDKDLLRQLLHKWAEDWQENQKQDPSV